MPEPKRDNTEEGRRDEAELVRRVLEGDMSAFTDLIKPYEDKISGWCRDGGKLWNAEDIDDAVLDTLERTYESLPKFNCDRVFEPWLRRIARRRGIDMARRQGRHPRMVSLESLVTDETTARDQGWQDQRADDPMVSALEREIVQMALKRLPKRQREALELQCRGFPKADIADTLETTEDAVVVLLRRARTRFEEVYRKLGEEK